MATESEQEFDRLADTAKESVRYATRQLHSLKNIARNPATVEEINKAIESLWKVAEQIGGLDY